MDSIDGVTEYTYDALGQLLTEVKDGTKILWEKWECNTLIPLYDNEDSVCGIIYNGVPYYFHKNLQGDIIAIADRNGEVVARYTYDAWGKCEISVNSTNAAIAEINPYRYRGYYFDTETGFYYLRSRYYDPIVGRFINADNCLAWDVEKTVFTTQLFAYCENDPINQTDSNGNVVLKIIIRAIVGAIFGAAMQYLADVLQNLIDCVIDKKKVSKNIWKVRSGIGDYISAIASGAVDATLKLGVWASLGSSIAATIVGHLINFAKGKGFNFQSFVKDLVWSALLSLVTSAICKKFKPARGKELNKYIRARYKVKGTKAYKRHWKYMCECIEWNGFVVSTLVNTLRSASRRILDFVEAVLFDCIIKAFAKAF